MAILGNIKLWDRVAQTFAWAFCATYLADIGPGVPLITQVADLSLAHKALLAGVAAVVQLALGTLIAPHVGDPETPDLIPRALLKDPAPRAPLAVDLTQVLQAIMDDLKARYPDVEISIDDIARSIVERFKATAPDGKHAAP